MELSVTSSARNAGSRPDSANAASTSPTRLGSHSCRGETLTLIVNECPAHSVLSLTDVEVVLYIHIHRI